MKTNHYLWFYIPLFLIVAIITGCYSEHEIKQVVELTVVQDTDATNKVTGYSGTVIPESGSAKLKAIAVFHDGSINEVTHQVAWSSSDSSIAQVDEQGWVRAQAGQSGQIQITAAKDGVTVSHDVTVTDAILLSIELVPHEITISKGEKEALQAKGTYTDGSIRYLDFNDGIVWKSSHPMIASVDYAGFVTGVEASEIEVLISASLGDIVSTNTTNVMVLDRTLSQIKVVPDRVVLPKSTSTQLNVIGIYTDGSEGDITDQVDWKEDDVSIARMSESGELRGISDGNTFVTAFLTTNNELSAVSTVEVTETRLLSIQITPALIELPVGGMHQFTAIGEFDDEINRDITSLVSWESSDELRVEINSSGELTTKSVGVAEITATLDGVVSNTSHVFVNTSVLKEINLTPLDIQLPVNQDAPVKAQGLMSDGSTLNISSLVAWHSSDSSVVSVDDSGYITGMSDGSAQISAYLNSIESTAPVTVTVTEAALESILITSNAEVNIGMDEQLEAIGFYSDDSIFDLTDRVNWASDDTSIAVVSNAGIVNGVSEGVANIEASYGEITSLIRTKVSVLPATLTDIKITSDSGEDTIVAGYEKTYIATGVFSDGTEAPLTGSDVFWLSSDVDVATVSFSGEVKGIKKGSSNLTALKGGIASSEPVAITVTEAELVSVTVVTQDNDIPMGLSTQVTAIGKFSDGSVVNPLTNVVWSSSNDNATVDQNGLVTGITSGSADIAALSDGIQESISIRILDKTLVGLEINPFSYNGHPDNESWLPNHMSYVQLTADHIYSDGSREPAPASQLHWFHIDSATGYELLSDGRVRSSTSYMGYYRRVRVADYHNLLQADKSVRTGNLPPDKNGGCGKLGDDYRHLNSEQCISVLSANVLDVNSPLVMAPLNRVLLESYGLSADRYTIGAMPGGGDAASYFTGSASKINALCDEMNKIELYGLTTWEVSTPEGVPLQNNYNTLFDIQGDMTGRWPYNNYYAYDADDQDLYFRMVTGDSGSSDRNDFSSFFTYYVGCSATPYPEMKTD